MIVRIPLPWWSPQAYDIVNDVCRGGWRRLFIEFSTRRPLSFGGYARQFTFRCAIGAKFKPLSQEIT